MTSCGKCREEIWNMKKTIKKLNFQSESIRNLTCRVLVSDEIARVVGGSLGNTRCNCPTDTGTCPDPP